MGVFLKMASVRDVAPPQIVSAVQDWFGDQGVRCEPVVSPSGHSHHDMLSVYQQHNGWTTIILPMYFIPIYEVTSHMSARAQSVASSIDVYDSDRWRHAVFDNGDLVDEYSIDFRYDVSNLDDPLTVARRMRGKPDVVAQHLGGSAREIARHYRRNRRSRSYDDWNFVDLWAEIGIAYPDERTPSAAHLVLTTGWEDQLRSNN